MQRDDEKKIGRRLRQLRGDLPSGRYFVPAVFTINGQRPYTDIGDAHSWDAAFGQCTRCKISVSDANAYDALKKCSGAPPKEPVLIYSIPDNCVEYFWQPDGSVKEIHTPQISHFNLMLPRAVGMSYAANLKMLQETMQEAFARAAGIPVRMLRGKMMEHDLVEIMREKSAGLAGLSFDIYIGDDLPK